VARGQENLGNAAIREESSGKAEGLSGMLELTRLTPAPAGHVDPPFICLARSLASAAMEFQ
jgi:hypothetical protein